MAVDTSGSQLSGDIGSIISLISGIKGPGSGWQNVVNMADPWAPNRSQYQTQLNNFMNDPSAIFNDPAFQAAQKVGAENISRQAGAAGMASSGNRLADLFSYGQSSALDFEKQKYAELANLAGVNAGSPVAAAGLAAQGLQTQGTNLATGLAGIAPIIASLLGLAPSAAGGLVSLLSGAGNSLGRLFGGLPSGTSTTDVLPYDPTQPYGGGFNTGSGGAAVTDPNQGITIGGTQITDPYFPNATIPEWTPGFDLSGGGDLPGWVSGFDLGGG